MCAIQLFVTLLAVAHQAPMSLRLSRQKYQNGWPSPPPSQPRD